jgi:hypothetical protein
MSTTASPARVTADSAAATNDRATGNRRSSELCETKTLRGDDPIGQVAVTLTFIARTE